MVSSICMQVSLFICVGAFMDMIGCYPTEPSVCFRVCMWTCVWSDPVGLSLHCTSSTCTRELVFLIFNLLSICSHPVCNPHSTPPISHSHTNHTPTHTHTHTHIHTQAATDVIMESLNVGWIIPWWGWGIKMHAHTRCASLVGQRLTWGHVTSVHICTRVNPQP